MSQRSQSSAFDKSELVLRTKIMASVGPTSATGSGTDRQAQRQEALAQGYFSTPGEKASTSVPQINITTITHPPSYAYESNPATFWKLQVGFNLKSTLILLFCLYTLWGLQGLLRCTQQLGSAIYTATVNPLSLFSIASLTCTTIGYGCPVQSLADTHKSTGLDPYRAAEMAASINSEATYAQTLIEQVLNVASGPSVRTVRSRQEDLKYMSRKLRYRTVLKNRERLGSDTKAVSVELGLFGDSLIVLAVDSQTFLAYFINEFLHVEEDLHAALEDGTHEEKILFEKRFGNFLIRFTDHLQEYQTAVAGALAQSKSIIEIADQLLADFEIETDLMLAHIEAKGYVYAYLLKVFTFEGQAETFALEIIKSASNIATSASAQLSDINDGLLRMITTLRNLSVLPTNHGPVDDPAKTFRMLKATLSNLMQRKMLITEMFGQEFKYSV